MVFQNYALYPHMTVYDNIGFALKLAGVPQGRRSTRGCARRRRCSSSRSTSTASRASSRAASASGWRWVGRSCASRPAFLMDEPLSNLDAKLRVQMRAEIAALQRDLGVTTIYVTHDQVEAMTMGDRVAVLKDGYLQQVDTPQNLYDRPDNVFVAAFIGSPSMNLYEAELTVDGDGGTLQLGSQRAADRRRGARPPTGAARLRRPAPRRRHPPRGLRGCHARPGRPSPTVACRHRCKLVEALGSELMVHFGMDVRNVDSGDPDALEEA